MSHEERGRVDRTIRTIWGTLTKIGTSDHTSMTVLQWETLFSKVVNPLDNLPIAKGNTTRLRTPSIHHHEAGVIRVRLV